MKKDIESNEEDIKPKLRRKPTELDSDDDEDTVNDVKPLKQVFIEKWEGIKWNEVIVGRLDQKNLNYLGAASTFILRVLILNHRKLKLVFNHQLLPQR